MSTRPTLSRLMSLPLVAAFVFSVTACGDTGVRTKTPVLQVDPQSIQFQFFGPNQLDVQALQIENGGDGELVITEVIFDTSPANVLQLQLLTVSPEAPLRLEPGQSQTVFVEYTPLDATPLTGQIVLESNATRGGFGIPVSGESSTPRPDFFPPRLDFGTVAESTTNTLSRDLINVGTAPLILCDVRLVGGGALFASNISEAVAAATNAGVGYAVLDTQDRRFNVGETSIPFEITYAPTRPSDGDTADLLIEYDASGNVDAPCADGNTITEQYAIAGRAVIGDLLVEPCPLDFGLVPIDVVTRNSMTMSSIEDLSVEILNITFENGSTTDGVFLLEDLPTFPTALDTDNNSEAFVVGFRPELEQAYATTLNISYINSRGENDVQQCVVTGSGSPECPPTAVATGYIREDAERRRGDVIEWAVPLQTVILDGSGSFDPCGGEVVDYQWDLLDAPDGAITSIRETNVTNEAGVVEAFLPIAGRYTFALTVFDEVGIPSGEPAEVTVVAIPDEAISVELTWRTPGDPDEADTDGSDVDLHVVRLGAPWFDPLYDVYYGNTSPVWSPEEPSLDVDDTDGGGPETFNLDNPANCIWYAIGVHYFKFAWSTAYANIRIYINSGLSDELVNKPMREEDFYWDVARIHWPSGQVYRVDEMLEGFDSNAGITPALPPAAVNSGLCGSI
jgi:hypothetical protein